MKRLTLKMGMAIIILLMCPISAMNDEQKLNKRGQPQALSMFDDISEHDAVQLECEECQRNCKECCEDCNVICSTLGESLKRCMIVSMGLITLDSFRAYLAGHNK